MGICRCCGAEGATKRVIVSRLGIDHDRKAVCDECQADIIDIKMALTSAMHPSTFGLLHHALKDVEPRMKPIMVAVPKVGWVLMGFIPDVAAIDQGEPRPHVQQAIEAYARGILGIAAEEEGEEEVANG